MLQNGGAYFRYGHSLFLHIVTAVNLSADYDMRVIYYGYFKDSRPVVLINLIIKYKIRITRHLVEYYHIFMTVILRHVLASQLCRHHVYIRNLKGNVVADEVCST